jgi:hypothetical protein
MLLPEQRAFRSISNQQVTMFTAMTSRRIHQFLAGVTLRIAALKDLD